MIKAAIIVLGLAIALAAVSLAVRNQLSVSFLPSASRPPSGVMTSLADSNAVDVSSTTPVAPTATTVKPGPKPLIVKNPRIVSTLRLGSKNKVEVTKLQQILQKQGYYKGAITGKFDDATDTALRDFQAKYGILENGTGVRTRNALNKFAK